MDDSFILTVPNWVPLAVTAYLLIGALVVAVYNTAANGSNRWDGVQSFMIALFWLPIALYWAVVAGLGALLCPL